MARSRNIKPGFFANEDLADLPLGARLLFIGLWTLADRAGRLDDRPKKIRGELFRFDNITTTEIDEWLDCLASKGFIVRYEAGGSYIQVTNFVRHQNPHKNEVPSVIPPIPQQIDNIRECSRNVPSESGQNPSAPEITGGLAPTTVVAPADSLLLIPDSGFLNPSSAPEPVARVVPFATRKIEEPKEWPHSEAFQRAWNRHHKNRRTETLPLVAQFCIGMEIDWEAVDRIHPAYCAYWDETGWSVCPLTFKEWMENGMPEPPPKARDSPSFSQSNKFAALDQYVEARVKELRDGR